MSGSTAPVILSPLEAWPARPSPRASPLSSRASSMSSADAGPSSHQHAMSPSKSSDQLEWKGTGTSALSATMGRTASDNVAAPSRSWSIKGKGKATAQDGSTMQGVQTPPPRLRLVKGSTGDGDRPTRSNLTTAHNRDPHSNPDDHPYNDDDDYPDYSNMDNQSGPSTSNQRGYGPPRKPLTPNQLGRIAQSFGIVIPSLPLPSPTSTSLSPLQRTTATRSPNTIIHQSKPMRAGTPWLLTVIPPFSILLPLNPSQGGPGGFEDPESNFGEDGIPSATSEAGASRALVRDRERRKRWKRGRLLPLQPTMGSMLLSIAREYGLPSTQGINLYLVHQPPPTHLSAGTHSHSGHSQSISSATSFSSFGEEASGPRISAQTWTTLFASYLIQSASSSRAGTPAHTPLKSAGPLGRDIPFPPSPLSLGDQSASVAELNNRLNAAKSSKTGKGNGASGGTAFPRRPSDPTTEPHAVGGTNDSKLSSKSSSSSLSAERTAHSNLPPTPHSYSHPLPAQPSLASPMLNPVPVNPIVGSIEFEVDLDVAMWYEDWRRSSRGRHTRKISSVSDSGLATSSSYANAPPLPGSGGMRQLRLVQKVQDGRDGPARFLRDLDTNQLPSPSRPWMQDKPRSLSVSHTGVTTHQKGTRSFSATHPRSAGAGASHETEEANDVQREMDNISALLGTQPPGGASIDSEEAHSSSPKNGPEQSDELLASPIALDQGHLDRMREMVDEVREGIEKRGSGLVMSDELDKLEQIMRTLSPREIRVTSPRMLTPRMAAKIAAAKIQAESVSKPANVPTLPSHSLNTNPSRSPLLPSPLAATFTASTVSEVTSKDHSQPSSATTTTSARSIGSSKNTASAALVKAKSSTESSSSVSFIGWPAVPYAGSPDSPRLDEYFQPKSTFSPLGRGEDVPSPRSAETLQRAGGFRSRVLGSIDAGDLATAEWKPLRPTRPLSPGLEGHSHHHHRTESHTLPAEFVNQLNQNRQSQQQTQQALGQSSGDGRLPSPVIHAPRRKFSPLLNGNTGSGLAKGSIGESPRSASAPTHPERERRTASNTFRKLRDDWTSKSISLRRGEKPSSPHSPSFASISENGHGPANHDSGRTETVGLFNGQTMMNGDGATSFASLQPSAKSGTYSSISIPARHGSPRDSESTTPKDAARRLVGSLPRNYVLATQSPPLGISEFGMDEIPSPPTHTSLGPRNNRSNTAPSGGPGGGGGGIASLSGVGKGVTSRFFGVTGGFTFGKKPSLPTLRRDSPTTAHAPSRPSISASETPAAAAAAAAISSIPTASAVAEVVDPIPYRAGSTDNHSSHKHGKGLSFSGTSRMRGFRSASWNSTSKRNASIDASVIGSPIPSTFRQVDGTGPAARLNSSPIIAHFLEKDGNGHVYGEALPSPPLTGNSVLSGASGLSGTSGTSTELPYRSPPTTHEARQRHAQGNSSTRPSGEYTYSPTISQHPPLPPLPPPPPSSGVIRSSTSGEWPSPTLTASTSGGVTKRKPVPGLPSETVIEEEENETGGGVGAGAGGTSGVRMKTSGSGSASGHGHLGMTTSDSFASTHSFILEDPPKRRVW